MNKLLINRAIVPQQKMEESPRVGIYNKLEPAQGA